MAYVCSNAENYEGKVVANGQCVRFVQVAANVPHTSQWRPGEQVKASSIIQKGTAIATFINGIYPNNAHGNHAAIYISHDASGIKVWDQWTGKAVSSRTIGYKEGDNDPSNDGDFFYVIE